MDIKAQQYSIPFESFGDVPPYSLGENVALLNAAQRYDNK